MRKLTHYGNPNIGVFGIANNKVSFLSSDVTKKFLVGVKENLKTEVQRVTIANGNVIGMHVAMNNKIALLPWIAEKEEVEKFREFLDVLIIKTRKNALGNNLLMNDKGIIASINLEKEVVKEIEDKTGLEVLRIKFGEYKTVGSLGFANNKGCLLSYHVKESEKEKVKDILKVYVGEGSVNMGSQFIRLGIIGNDNGYVVGEETTGIEIAQIEEVLDYIK